MNKRRSALKFGMFFLILSTCILPHADAHFIWVYAEEGKVKVVFGEGLEPDQAQFLSGLSSMQAFGREGDSPKALRFEKQVDGDEGWFEIAANDAGSWVEVACAYGVFGRGEQTMFLDYSAKYVALSTPEATREMDKASDKLALDIVPKWDHGKLVLVAYFQGKPIEGVEIQLESVETESSTQVTNQAGEVALQTAARYVIRAKHTVPEAGEVDGEKFSERRFYCTLVLDVAAPRDASSDGQRGDTSQSPLNSTRVGLKRAEAEFSEFPIGITSFGAALLDNHIFVVGGKSGRAHEYARSYQNRNVYRLNLDRNNEPWEVVADNLGLQGLAVVGHDGKMYRIGGLEARNKEGEEQDLHSINDFLAFDPVKKTWSKMPDLPDGRSSIDACVVGEQLYVVGGWTMAGEKKPVWLNDMLRFDLSQPESGWEQIETPFTTRALAVCANQGKLVVIGGIQQKGGLTNAVHFFDLQTGQWSLGPEVPAEDDMKSFGCSAISLGDNLLVSTYGGGIFRLAENRRGSGEWGWEKVYQLDIGRFFHQMIPLDETRFALIGGAHMEYGRQTEVEIYEITDGAAKKIANH